MERDEVEQGCWNRALSWFNRVDDLGKRQSQGAFAQPIERKGQDVEDSKTAADGRFAVTEGVPRKADPRIEIMQRRIRQPIVRARLRDARVQAGGRSEKAMNLSG